MSKFLCIDTPLSSSWFYRKITVTQYVLYGFSYSREESLCKEEAGVHWWFLYFNL